MALTVLHVNTRKFVFPHDDSSLGITCISYQQLERKVLVSQCSNRTQQANLALWLRQEKQKAVALHQQAAPPLPSFSLCGHGRLNSPPSPSSYWTLVWDINVEAAASKPRYHEETRGAGSPNLQHKLQRPGLLPGKPGRKTAPRLSLGDPAGRSWWRR